MYTESSFPGCSNDPSLGSLDLSKAKQSSFDEAKMICKRFLVPETGRNSQTVVSDSNIDCSAQDRLREMKLVSLELPGNEDSKYMSLKLF
jgi:hypothetical protein